MQLPAPMDLGLPGVLKTSCDTSFAHQLPPTIDRLLVTQHWRFPVSGSTVYRVDNRYRVACLEILPWQSRT